LQYFPVGSDDAVGIVKQLEQGIGIFANVDSAISIAVGLAADEVGPQVRARHSWAGSADDFEEFNTLNNRIGLAMEMFDMGMQGWLVDTRSKTCSCRHYSKFGMCVHLYNLCRVKKVTVRKHSDRQPSVCT
jgi:hypothetical protein